MAVLHTFTFAENEGPIVMAIEFAGVLGPSASLDDYHLHAHIKAAIEDTDIVFDANTVAGSLVITDPVRMLAEIEIPLSTVEADFAGGGSWVFDVLMIEKVTGERINAGRFALISENAATRGVE